MSEPLKDIYRESGFRLPFPNREELDEEEKKIFDQIVGPGGRTIAGLKGPSGINLHNPRLAALENALNQYLRFESGLSGRIRELAILVTAREMNSKFEWAAHEKVALKEGVQPDIIDIIKLRKNPANLSKEDAIIIKLGREMFTYQSVSADTFNQALQLFGKKRLLNLVALMTNYCSTAVKLRVFNNQVEPDQPVLPTLKEDN